MHSSESIACLAAALAKAQAELIMNADVPGVPGGRSFVMWNTAEVVSEADVVVTVIGATRAATPGALQIIDEARGICDDTGERWAMAEVLRSKASFLSSTSSRGEIERILLESS